MRRKAIDLILLLAILVGGALAWTSGRERAKLTKEYTRLARTAGDPAKVHLVALDTGEPLHFAWRVYYPANYRAVLTNSLGVQSSSSTSNPTEAILRLRFFENDRGLLEVYVKGAQGRSQGTLGDGSLAGLLRAVGARSMSNRSGRRMPSSSSPTSRCPSSSSPSPGRCKRRRTRSFSNGPGRIAPRFSTN